jgi:predicted naringenin-chalcone synthase
MYLHALSTAVPERSFTQAQCWEFIERSHSRLRLTRRSRLILHSILRNDHGIAKRHFAVPDIENVFDLTPDQLNAAFRHAAPELAGRALKTALDQAGIVAAELDALLICTCTGYLCPGLTSYVAEQLGLRSDAILQDLVGLGCGAAIPTIRSASHVLAAHPDATIACVAVEVCSAAFYLDDDPGVLISACLFSDGAAATIWRSQQPRGASNGLRCFDFQTLHRPAERDKLRFETRNGKLRNLLHDTVPELAANAAAQLWETRGPRPVARVVAHSGGLDVLESLGRAFPGYSLEASARVLRDCGNMSSPSVLFALAETLRMLPPGSAAGDMWLITFGAGFSAHSCRIGE